MARPANKPVAVTLCLEDAQGIDCELYYACIVLFPDKPFPKFDMVEGKEQARGILMDAGYEFKMIKQSFTTPRWIIRKVPSQYNIISLHDIIKFPSPK